MCSTYIEHECKAKSGSILSSHINHVASRKFTRLFTFSNGCLPSLKMPKIISYWPASVTFHPNFDEFNCFSSLFEIIFEILTAG